VTVGVVVVVVVVLFCLVVFQENIAWLGGIAGILGDVRSLPTLPTLSYPLVALIYGIGKCASGCGGKEGFLSVRPCFSWLG
jgi:hypothetical protein